MSNLNKKGIQEFLSIWWMLMFVLVVGAIVIAVLIFNSAELDTREVEAELLSEKLLGCLIEEGVMIESVLENDFDVFSECGISEEIFDGESDFYFSVSILNDKEELLREEIIGGDNSFVVECGIVESKEGEEIKAEHFPKCVEKESDITYFIDEEGLNGKIVVLAASNQRGGKVPVI